MAGAGFAIGLFGLASLVLACVCFPLLRLVPGDEEKLERRNQFVLHLYFRFFIGLLVRLGIMELDVVGGERLAEPGVLVVANHPTLIDALILMAYMPQADCVVKADHYDNVWLAATIKGAGYIPNRNGSQVVEECVRRLERGRSVLIFPEGTRSPKDQLGDFSRGAAHIALRAGCSPLPVTITCRPATLYRGLPWWKVPDRRFRVTVSVAPRIAVDPALAESMPRPRAARLVNSELRGHFERQLLLAHDQHAS